MVEISRKTVKQYEGQKAIWMELDAPVDATAEVIAAPAASAAKTAGEVLTSFGKTIYNLIKKTEHPFVAIFHVLFKLLAILIFVTVAIAQFILPRSWFSESQAFFVSFISVVILSAIDFWVVKNVTGRILVGMRWWSDVDEDGKQIWIFESLDKHDVDIKLNMLEVFWFWMVLLITPVIWVAIFILEVIRLQLISLLCFVAIILLVANLIGYVRCKKDARSMAMDFVKRGGTKVGRQAARRYLEHKLDEITGEAAI